MSKSNFNVIPRLSNAYSIGSARVFFALAAVLSPVMAWAAPAPKGFEDTSTKVCSFFTNINSILDAASIVVVTLAVIIAGYQIAFAHKRISDVAPVLIGGVLIGIASQVASMLIGDDHGTDATSCSAMLVQAFHSYYA